jgi:hypothetical protein
MAEAQNASLHATLEALAAVIGLLSLLLKLAA